MVSHPHKTQAPIELVARSLTSPTSPTHHTLLLPAGWNRATELEGLTNLGTTMADGATGETSAVRELHTALRDVREGLTKAKKLWKAAEEAADKCQVCIAVMVYTE